MNRKMNKYIVLVTTLIITNLLFAQKPIKSDLWAFDVLNIPVNKTKIKDLKKITIAVVDDGFMLSHKDIAPYLHKNELEIENNFIDDDGNNYIDDYYGWDVADEDANVNIPLGKETIYYHGSFVTSIITRVAKLHYGEKAKDFIKILPVKVLEDQASQTYLKKGYEGVQYAIDNGADIICLSWSGGFPTEKQKNIIKQAEAKGIIIVSSAGNFNQRKVLYPANFNEVIAVSGIGVNLDKGKYANYGNKIAISAPSEYVKGAFTTAKNSYIHDNGTSASAALITGVIAILKTKKPSLDKKNIESILYNSSTNFNEINKRYKGLLGSGIVNVEKAIESIKNTNLYFNSLKSRGAVSFAKKNRDSTYHITPEGVYLGFYLDFDVSKVKNKKNKLLNIYAKDTLWKTYKLKVLPNEIFVPSNSFSLNIDANLKKKDIFKVSYKGKLIDSTKLYCKEITTITKSKGTVTNESMGNNYVNNTSCKWQINAPKGKRVKIVFNKMDTEPNIDFVYIAEGKSLVKENIIAKFSGNNLPPKISSYTNQVLIWFMTDDKTTGKGWEFDYEFID